MVLGGMTLAEKLGFLRLFLSLPRLPRLSKAERVSTGCRMLIKKLRLDVGRAADDTTPLIHLHPEGGCTLVLPSYSCAVIMRRQMLLLLD